MTQLYKYLLLFSSSPQVEQRNCNMLSAILALFCLLQFQGAQSYYTCNGCDRGSIPQDNTITFVNPRDTIEIINQKPIQDSQPEEYKTNVSKDDCQPQPITITTSDDSSTMLLEDRDNKEVPLLSSEKVVGSPKEEQSKDVPSKASSPEEISYNCIPSSSSSFFPFDFDSVTSRDVRSIGSCTECPLPLDPSPSESRNIESYKTFLAENKPNAEIKNETQDPTIIRMEVDGSTKSDGTIIYKRSIGGECSPFDQNFFNSFPVSECELCGKYFIKPIEEDKGKQNSNQNESSVPNNTECLISMNTVDGSDATRDMNQEMPKMEEEPTGPTSSEEPDGQPTAPPEEPKDQRHKNSMNDPFPERSNVGRVITSYGTLTDLPSGMMDLGSVRSSSEEALDMSGFDMSIFPPSEETPQKNDVSKNDNNSSQTKVTIEIPQCRPDTEQISLVCGNFPTTFPVGKPFEQVSLGSCSRCPQTILSCLNRRDCNQIPTLIQEVNNPLGNNRKIISLNNLPCCQSKSGDCCICKINPPKPICISSNSAVTSTRFQNISPLSGPVPQETLVRQIKPVYEEVIRNVPVLKNVVRNRVVETTRQVPIMEKHIVQEQNKVIRNVPVIQKVTRNVVECRTKHVPVMGHRTRTVEDTCTVHVPHTQKFTRPVMESVLRKIPVVFSRFKPVLRERIRHVPVVETRCRPFLEQSITSVPVRKRIIKNVLQDNVRPVICSNYPLGQNLGSCCVQTPNANLCQNYGQQQY